MSLKRKLAILAILSTVSLVAIFGILEGGARLMGLRAGRRRVFDAERGWTYVPNTVFQYYATTGRVHCSVDGEGYRPPVAGAPGSPSIICLGDSYTFCGESPDDRTWPEYLAKSLATRGFACRAINRGVTGYSSVQSLVALRRELRRPGGESHPKAVLYFFCLNDPEENFASDRPHLDPAEFSGAAISATPRELRPDDPPPRSWRVFLRDLRGPSAFINGLKTRPPDSSPAGFAAGAATFAGLYGPYCQDILGKADFQAGMRHVLRALKKECDAAGATLFVSMSIAPAWDAPGDARRELCDLVKWSDEKMEKQAADYHAVLDLVKSMTTEAGAMFLDIHGSLAGMKYQEYVAASDDWHFSAAANERIGTSLADRMYPLLRR